MPADNDLDLAGLPPDQLRLVLLIERRLEHRLTTKIDARLAHIRRRIDAALFETEAVEAIAGSVIALNDGHDDEESEEDED